MTAATERCVILYVDDEEANTLVFIAAFCDAFDIVVANSPGEALAIAGRLPIAIVIADQRMPEMSGVELLARFGVEWPSTIRVLLTAYSDQSTVIDAINRGGVRRFMTKPWNAAEVRVVLYDMVRQIQMERSLVRLRERIASEERASGIVLAQTRGFEAVLNLAGTVEAGCSRLIERIHAANGPILRMQADVMVAELTALVDAARAAHEAAVSDASAQKPVRGAAETDGADGLVVEAVRLAIRLTHGSVCGYATVHEWVPLDLRVRADRTTVARIISNLLTNAAMALQEAGRTDGRIDVSARSVDGCCELSVADDGPGVPEAVRGQVFAPLFTTWARHGRTGLGLSMSLDLARSLGGDLWLVTTPGEGGARFVLRVP